MRLDKKSIKERKEFNKELYKKIFKITKKPKKILDLGCGLNPLSFPYKDMDYTAIDINKDNLKKVKKHFKKNKIDGKVFYFNIEQDDVKVLDKVDIVISFKVFDMFNRNKNKVLQLLKDLKTKYIIISFATKTASGKRMKNPKRKWFENILKKLNLNFETLRFYNEIVYIIKK